MKVVIQRVKEAKVAEEGSCVGSIQRGFLILLGIGKEDTKEVVDKYLDKIIQMRIFADEQGKTNLALKDVGGEILVISQFTLYANCKRGNRPDFINAAGPDIAKELYEYFLLKVADKMGSVQSGVFGADMEVSLINDGPFTIILDETNMK